MTTDLQPYALVKPTEEHRHFAKPFSLAGAKRTIWSVACDRAWLVALRKDLGLERWKGSGETLSHMLKYIQAKPQSPHRVSVARLTDWIGLVDKDELGRICEAALSLDRVLKLLKLVPSDEVTIWDASELALGQPCLGMEDGHFRAMLMGHDPKKIEVVKREFNLTPPEQSAFELAMSLDNE